MATSGRELVSAAGNSCRSTFTQREERTKSVLAVEHRRTGPIPITTLNCGAGFYSFRSTHRSIPSMSHRRDGKDNAHMEPFVASLKRETMVASVPDRDT